jgi:voltage-dependent potassium channel beta subunit
MNYRRLGNAGIRISAIGLGGWTTFGDSIKDPAAARELINTAYDRGVNFFDMADAYAKGESEKMMGQFLKAFPRHTLVLTSKLFRPMSSDVNDQGLSRKHIMESIDRSLARIGTDYLDLYFCHRDDPETPLEETVRAMDDLIHAGKILYWGTSEWPASKIEEAVAIAEKFNLYKPQVEQSQYSLLFHRRVTEEILPVTNRHGLGLVTYSPLASGLLTGKYDEGLPEESRLARLGFLKEAWYKETFIGLVRELKPVAEALGLSRSQLALAWILRQPGIHGVITGATRLDQLESNLKALDVSLSPETMTQIDRLFFPAGREK